MKTQPTPTTPSCEQAIDEAPPTQCVGVLRTARSLMLYMLQDGRRPIDAGFPATSMGVEAIRVYLDGHAGPVRVAVDGASVDFALRWASCTLASTTLVKPVAAASAKSLAQYATTAV